MHSLLKNNFIRAPVYRLFLLVILVICVGEVAIMFILPKILPDSTSPLVINLFDAFLLALVTSAVVLPLLANFRQLASDSELALNITSEGFWSIDIAGHVVSVNDGYCQLTGYSRAEIIGAHLSHFEPKTSWVKMNALIDKISTEGHQRYETSHKCKSGRLINVEVSVSYVQESKHLICFIRDMTERKRVESALRNSALNLQATLDNSPYLVWLKDASGRYMTINKALAQFMGLQHVKDVINKTDLELWPAELAEKYRADDAEIMASGLSKHIEEQIFDGKHLNWIETYKTPIIDENGHVLGTTGFACDITERKNVEEATQAAAQYSRSLIEASLDPLVTISVDGKITDTNTATELVTGQERAVLIGSDFADYFTEPTKAREAYQQAFISGFVSDCPLAIRHLSGKVTDVLYNASIYRDVNGEVRGVFAAARDITERKKTEEIVHHLAFYDALTKLPNRRLLKDRLNQAVALSKRNQCYGALVVLDLDNFKPLNDTHGHLVGDLLLIEVARRLISSVRESDTVARFGGDEFVILLNSLNVSESESILQARAIAEKIRVALSGLYTLNINRDGEASAVVEHHCTASLGVAMFLDNKSDLDDILERADKAMYQAKEAGRNRIHFSQ